MTVGLDFNHASTDDVPPAGPAASDQQMDQYHRTAQLKQMKSVSELRPLCRQYGLPVVGTKSEVIQRILDHEKLTLRL